MSAFSENYGGGTSASNIAHELPFNQQEISVSRKTSDAPTPSKAGGSTTPPMAPLKVPPPSTGEEDMPDGSFVPRYEGINLFPETPPTKAVHSPPALTRTSSVIPREEIHPRILFPEIPLPLARSSSASDENDLPPAEQPVLQRGVTAPF
jgi:hypothetical protein